MDFVDLTTSPEDPPAPQRRTKRQRSLETNSGDLTSDRHEEQQARQRIMQHAAHVNRERGVTAYPCVAEAQRQQLEDPAAGKHTAPPAAGASIPGAPHQAAESPQAAGNMLLAELHAERMARQVKRQNVTQQPLPTSSSKPDAMPAQRRLREQQQQQQPPSSSAEGMAQLTLQQRGNDATELRLLTWNVWFREDLHVTARMAAIGAVVQARQPHFVCLQEVTPLIYRLLAESPWWRCYHASPCPPDVPYFTALLSHSSVQPRGACRELPFENSAMGRDLKTVCGSLGGWPVRVATTHLESPLGWNQMNRAARVAQCKQSVELLDQAPEEDVLLAGDTNWGPDDGTPPLPGGWSDAWLHLHSGDPGLTYDPKANPMLKPGNRIRRRLDRVWVKLSRWRLHRMELVGREALPGLQFEGRPVLPSDHFGLLLTLCLRA
ncbi:hypothetical protein D9Q98_007616 [Chlorella vulgaris]|uniref:Endonuclease/exonuclease/phosphatase domain-containing protein n=1 Tax=Chlorella vulgaris TaxID=3077 RepID=A0A9D4TLX1_CHLVU|nr:hypothetical protein D9Q98_007616 [Chlorella vulgaris]